MTPLSHGRLTVAVGVVGWLASAPTLASPTLDDLQRLEDYAFCEQDCAYGSRASYGVCLSQCGDADPSWDFDGDGNVDGEDYRRALRLYWGEPDCAGVNAGSTACLDEDSDGLVKWQEAALGTTDAPGLENVDTLCTDGVVCGFLARCVFSNPADSNAVPLDVGYCATREGCDVDPPADTCTSFHLEMIEETDQEVVVYVHFDHAPVDVRVLDLHLHVPHKSLRLTNARALKLLEQAGKTVDVRPTGWSTSEVQEFRVMVFGTSTTHPIPRGAIVELVFSRVSATQSGAIAFSDDPAIRRRAMAPNPDPTPGDYDSPLEADHLWGSAVQVGSVAPSTPRLALYYSFDNSSLAPMPLLVPDEDTACGLLYDCDPNGSAQYKARYSAMQAGIVEAHGGIEGVTGRAAFLDGFSDHLELPVVFDDENLKDDDFSVSFWFYHEGDRRGTGGQKQVLFAHNTDLNRNGFGVELLPGNDSTFGLDWFEGDRSSQQTSRTPLARGLPDRIWLYFAASVDADGTGAATASVHVRHPTDPAYSTTNQVSLSDMVRGCLGTQQSKLALVDPVVKREAIFYASARNNLFGIARMDPNGMSLADVVRDSDSTALDPDFHPGNGKVVFVSSRTGSYEVWIANVDGSRQIQVTEGFGNTAAGRFVRRPRWSPNGTAIVFEANAFSSSRYYNTLAQSYQLYYVRYDPTAGRIVVPQASGDAGSMLDFATIEQLDSFYRYTLTGVDSNNHSNRYNFLDPHWLGNDRIVATRSGESFDHAELVWFDVSNTASSYDARSRITTGIDGPAYGLGDGDVRLLAAGMRNGATRTFYSEEVSRYESASASYRIGDPVWDGDELTVTVVYTRSPASFDDYCWDRNYNRVCDADTEDPDGDNTCNKLDCQPSELRDLYLFYDEDLEPVTDPFTGRLVADASPWILSNKPVDGDANGGLEVSSRFSSHGASVTVQVLHETSALPIPQETLLGTLRFRLKAGRTAADIEPDSFVPKVRRVHQDLRLYDSSTGHVASVELTGGLLDRVTGAAFSPTLERIVLAGVQDGRPVVVTSDDLVIDESAELEPRVEAYMHVISAAPMRVEGLSWHSFDSAFNCNWMGTYQQPSTGLYVDSFRGGLDEVRYHNAARSEAALDSEFERGTEWLLAAGRDGRAPARNAVCSSHLECAAYEQCWDPDGDGAKHCAPKPCEQQSDCGLEGSCRLMPVPLSQQRPEDGSGLQLVCAVDCVSSSQCYEQECLNGPCMFCQAGACGECRRMTGEFGIEYIEGCPDRNSFWCEEGSCLSDCYAFENGESHYLCDSSTEYCRQGRCVIFDWDWPELSPATFNGMGEMLSENHGGTPADPLIYTQATAQFHVVQIEAHGVADYLGAPEVMVEVHGNGMYEGDGWFEVGRVLVHNKTQTEAEDASRRYRLSSPYPFDAVRLRLVIPPYSNLNGAATGLGSRIAAHCEGNALNCAPRERLKPGSRAYLGYRIGIPEHVARLHRAGQDLLLDSHGLKYLYGGQPAVVVSGLWVGSVSSATELNLTALPACTAANSLCVDNRICPYDGGSSDADPARSGAAGVQLTPAPVKGYGEEPVAFEPSTEGYGLLNCVRNLAAAPGQSPSPAAELVVQNISQTVFVDGLTGRPNDGKHQETANACYVSLNVAGNVQNVPCYETYGSDPNFDPYNLASQAYRTLDIDTFRSFGYEMEQQETVAQSGQ